MERPFFSIVVPVYNVENYLNECIRSIIEQEYHDYEIILINDGSTDKSGALCNEFVSQNDQIRVIHQLNRGLSAARNTGIREANGQYLLFIDSDDYIAKNVFIKIRQIIVEQEYPDVVFLEAIKFYPDGSFEPMGDGYEKKKINGKTHEEVLKHISTLRKYPGSACTKAIKRDIIDDSLMFIEGLTSEDIEWTFRLFGKAKTYAYCSDPYYYYRQLREGSITYKSSPKKIKSLLWIMETWAHKKPMSLYRESVNSFIAYQYIILLLGLTDLDNEVFKPLYKRAEEMKWILRYGKSIKCKIVFITSSILGIKATSKLLKWYKGAV